MPNAVNVHHRVVSVKFLLNCKIGFATTTGPGQNPGMKAAKENLGLMFALLMTWPFLIHAQQNNSDDYRTVDGKLYNVSYSTNWAPLFILLDRETGEAAVLIKATQFVDDYVICEVENGNNIFINQVAVRNLARTGITSGDYVQAGVTVMKIKNARIGNQVLEAFDCGLPASPPKPIQPSKPATSTNSVLPTR